MTFSPILPLSLLIIAGSVLALLTAVLCWKAGQSLPPFKRILTILLYIVGVSGILALLANPGKMEKVSIPTRPIDLVVVDTSASMAAPLDGENPGTKRMESADKALAVYDKLRSPEIETIWASLGDNWREYDQSSPEKQGNAEEPASRISFLLENALRKYRMNGRQVRSVFLLSDGRDSSPQYLQSLLATANDLGAPIHTLALGGKWAAPDLVLDVPRPLLNAFPGSKTTITARIHNKNLPDAQVGVRLMSPEGTVVERKVVRVPRNENAQITFALDCPDKSAEFQIVCDSVPGEEGTDNNSETISIRVISAKIKVFLAEGSPYWDSKFLAQLLRGQPGFDVKSVHRLTSDRYYRINSGEDNSNAVADAGIPSTLQEFLQYDIIILGKGAEHIITAGAAEALQSFVRDHGGLLLFSRGKAYSGSFPGLEALEPFIWRAPLSGDFQLTPSQEGVQDGLFGQALPGPDDAAWSSLPGLSDAWDIDRAQPFTRILARGADNKTPLIAVRRIGLGAVAMINGDGLWKWDFFPEAKRLGDWYKDFWSQFLPWIQTSSEFRPGYNLSLHAEKGEVPPDSSVNLELSWRGMERPDRILIELFPIGSDSAEQSISPAYSGIKGGLPRWNGSLRLTKPGHYILRASIPDRSYEASPEIRLRVLSPPTEKDNLNADPAYLSIISEATGGKVLSPETWESSLPELVKAPEDIISWEDVFIPYWNQWWILCAIVLVLGAVWFIRRRQGLL